MFFCLFICRGLHGVDSIIQLVTYRGFGFPNGDGLAGVIAGNRSAVGNGQGLQFFTLLVIEGILCPIQDSVSLSSSGFCVAFMQLYPELFQGIGKGLIGYLVPFNVHCLVFRHYIPVGGIFLGQYITAADGDILEDSLPILAGNSGKIDLFPAVSSSGQPEGKSFFKSVLGGLGYDQLSIFQSVVSVFVRHSIGISVQRNKSQSPPQRCRELFVIAAVGAAGIFHLVAGAVPDADTRLDTIPDAISHMDIGDMGGAVPVVGTARESIPIGVFKGKGSSVPDIAGLIIDGLAGCRPCCKG